MDIISKASILLRGTGIKPMNLSQVPIKHVYKKSKYQSNLKGENVPYYNNFNTNSKKIVIGFK